MYGVTEVVLKSRVCRRCGRNLRSCEMLDVVDLGLRHRWHLERDFPAVTLGVSLLEFLVELVLVVARYVRVVRAGLYQTFWALLRL